jgi:hypothetical protein
MQGESRPQTSQPPGQGRHLQQQRPMTCSPVETQRDETASNTLGNFDKQDTPSEGRLPCFSSADTQCIESDKNNEIASTCGRQLQIEHCITFKFPNNGHLFQSYEH